MSGKRKLSRHDFFYKKAAEAAFLYLSVLIQFLFSSPTSNYLGECG